MRQSKMEVKQTCNNCNWVVMFPRKQYHRIGDVSGTQYGFCKRICERVEADDEACDQFAELNETARSIRRSVIINSGKR